MKNPFLSLKYRIAITVFVLEAMMLTAVLWQTQSFSYDLTETQIELKDELIVNLLAEASHNALTEDSFIGLQSLFEHIAQNEHVRSAWLQDVKNRVLVSSDASLFGQHKLPQLQDFEYLKKSALQGGIGELHVVFSKRELKQASEQAYQHGLTIGLFAMLLIAVVGLIMGYVLTRRLKKLVQHTRDLAQHNFKEQLDCEGDDEVSELAHALNDMSDELNKSFKHVEHLAYHDSLTGLVNRVEFKNRLTNAVDSSMSRGHKHALMFLDLDQFKIVNDMNGHEAGDELLVRLSNDILKVLRVRDTLARLGGDEFGILLGHCPITEALQIAEKVQQQVERFSFTWKERVFKVGVSIGVVEINEHSKSIEHLMSLADMACYDAKDEGGNTVVLASDNATNTKDRDDDMRWIAQLSDAIENDACELHFQKITGLNATENVLYGEFLLRVMINNQLVSPTKFIVAAERYQIMTKIDCFTVEKIFRQLSLIKPERRPKLNFVNLSGQTIGSSVFLNLVIDLIDELDIDPGEICFEITETAAFNNHDVAVEFIDQLRKLGFKFALDDFGSGLSGFSYLKAMPVDVLKIDGQYVVDMLNNEVDFEIVSAVNKIAHIANFLTIAEFVEDQATLTELKKIGLDFAQGDALHQPEPLENILLASDFK